MPYDLTMPDGTVLKNIPDEVNAKDAGNRYLMKFGPGQGGQQTPINPLPKSTVSGGNMLMHAIGQIPPTIGSLVAGPEGTIVGSLFRSSLPDEFGGAKDVGDVAGNVVGDLAGQELIPSVLGKLYSAGKTLFTQGPKQLIANTLASKPFSWNPSVQSAISNDKLLPFRNSINNILEDAASNTKFNEGQIAGKLAEAKAAAISPTGEANPPFRLSEQSTNTIPQQRNLFNDNLDRYQLPEKPLKPITSADTPQVKAAQKKYEDIFGENQVADNLLDLQKQVASGKDIAGNQSYYQISKRALNDVQSVRNFKLATGENNTINSLAQNELINNSFKGKDGTTFDPEAFLKQRNGSKKAIYDEALKDDSLEKLATQLPKNSTGSKLINFLNHRVTFMLPLAALGAESGHSLEGIAAAGSIVLGDKAITKLMSNPEMAKLVVAAAKTSKTNQAAPLLQRALLHGLGAGMEVVFQTPDGQQEKAVVNNGQVQIPQSAQ